jgi:hypothetical protein
MDGEGGLTPETVQDSQSAIPRAIVADHQLLGEQSLSRDAVELILEEFLPVIGTERNG